MTTAHSGDGYDNPENEYTSGFSASALGDYAPPAREKLKTEFKAWHKARKQFVRAEQWCKAINNLLGQLKLDGRPLRYIGLPGNELLDLRVIHDAVCKEKSVPLRFVGYNLDAKLGPDNKPGPNQIEVDLSAEEVRRLPGVDPLSAIIPDDFRSLSNTASVAWASAEKHGPYDIVNMDLCDSFGKDIPEQISDTYYNAIRELMSLQASRGEAWLLFLTSRVGDEYVASDTFNRLAKCVIDNLETCEPFLKITDATMGISSPEKLTEAAKTEKGYHDIYSLGLGKWLLRLGLSAQPKWQVKLADSLSYKVNKGKTHNDMISLVYEFTPIKIAPHDSAGLAASTATSGQALPTECDLALPIAEAVATTLDLDAYLVSNPAINESLIQQSAIVMESARYDRAEYIKWARKTV